MSSIAQNLVQVRDRIEQAATKSGREPSDIKLVAVSKLKPVEMIREAYEAGQRAFGENYAQDMVFKAKELADLDIEWHFIGHLQTNKAKLITPIASCIESIDSLKLAEELNKRLEHSIDVLIEVNLGHEETKTGVLEDELPQLIRGLADFEKLKIKGLMIIPPFIEDAEASRPYFRRLGQLMDRLNEEEIPSEPLCELSMGMSHDFEVAIEEGATIVRIGTTIFGEREEK